MPHAVIEQAESCPDLTNTLLAREEGRIHKVIETWTHHGGWVHKSLVTGKGDPVKLLVRVDKREDGLVVHLDDHLPVERAPEVFQHLAYIAARVLEANEGAQLGKTNLEKQIQEAQKAQKAL